MANVAVPVIRLRYHAADAYPNDIVDVFEKAGVWSQHEDYTFTGRVSLDPENHETPQRKAAITAELRALMPTTEANRLLALLDAHSWDVSFFVDCW